MRSRVTRAFASIVVVLACACTTTPPTPAPPPRPAAADGTAPFSSKSVASRLILVHLSDSEAGLLPDDAQPEVGGIARAQAVVRALMTRAGPDALVVGVGDLFMPSPELALELDGRSAVLQANDKLSLQASALGNHELDLGEQFLADAIAAASFPYLTATLEVKGGPLKKVLAAARAGTPWAHDIKGKLAPRAKVCVGGSIVDGACRGLTVGLVGATTEELRVISAGASANLALPDGLAGVRSAVQRHVDALRDEGIGVVVLLSHLQGALRERALIWSGLVGVDVVLAGGGENRLASKKHRLLPGDGADRLCQRWGEPCYPTTIRAKDGRPVLLAATGGQLQYVGNLITSYDEEGVLVGYNDTASRPWPVDEDSLLELRARADGETLAFEQRAKKELVPLLAEVAHSDVYFEGKREEVRNRETNLGDLSADALAFAARNANPRVAFALRNAGGIRGSIGTFDERGNKIGGPIRLLDLKSVLRFDAKVVVVETTHAELKATLESALRGAGTSKGQFPQVSGEVKLTYATHAPEQTHVLRDGRVAAVACPGARVRDLVITPPGGQKIVVVKDGALPTVRAKIAWATIDYLAHGGDGWFPAQEPVAGVVDKATEQSSLRAHIAHLDKSGAWNDGRAYPDDMGTRITKVDLDVEPVPACASAALAAE
jgi:2',3'-cyclic-nucleotide 2'-phosphodiesterase (5'-nucleotidase family)